MGVYIGANKTRLPSEYQEVEYIGSSGTQYINTGYNPSNKTKVVHKGYNVDNRIYGVGTGGSYYSIALYNGDGTHYRARCRSSSSGNSTVDSSVTCNTTSHIFECSQIDGLYIDGTKIGTFTQYTYTETRGIYLFGWNNNGTFAGGCNGRIYYMKIYENGTLVRDFVPCYRKLDSVIGLYDLVNSVFYTNAGTGTFTKGDDVLDKIDLVDAYIGKKEFRPKDPYCWYKFNGDYTDNTGSFGVASGTSTFATLDSGQKVLQTDGTNMVLLPSGVTGTAITTYTISFRMKTLTTSPVYGYYAGDGTIGAKPSMSFYESTSGRNYFEWTNSNSASKNNRDITISGMTTGWRMVTIRSNGTSRSDVSLTINATNTVSTGGASGSDSSSIFGWGTQFTIGARYSTADTSSSQRTSIQMSNFIISHSYWSDAEVQRMYDETKAIYGIS